MEKAANNRGEKMQTASNGNASGENCSQKTHPRLQREGGRERKRGGESRREGWERREDGGESPPRHTNTHSKS